MFDCTLNSLEQNAEYFAACHPQCRECRPNAPGARRCGPGLLRGALASCWPSGLIQACRLRWRQR